MMAAFDPNRVHYLSIAGSTALILFVLELIRRKWIRENYSLLWLFVSVLFLVFSLWGRGLSVVASLLGVSYPPSAFLLILVMAVFLILIQYSIILSILTNQNKRLAQEIGLINARLEKLEKTQPAKDDHRAP